MVEHQALEADLQAAVEGEVRFDDASRALYASDASNFRQVPIGVVVPRTVDDVVAAVVACRSHDAPVLPRGGGTSLAGQGCNVAVVLDCSKHLRRVLDLDPERRLARVQPGCVLDSLRERAGAFGLTFGPDPATHRHCTLGGMIGNDSCGIHSVMAGRTVDNVRSLEVLTYDGLRLRVGPTSEERLGTLAAGQGREAEIYSALRRLRDGCAELVRARFPDIPRRVSGYHLDQLLPENGGNVARALVGTEGTCVTVLEAEVELVPDPPARALLVLGYPDVYRAADHAAEVMAAGPIGCEGVDRQLFELAGAQQLHPQALASLPPGDGWLLVEFGGWTPAEAQAPARRLMDELGRQPGGPTVRLLHDAVEARRVWAVRESGLGATGHDPRSGRDYWPGWEDAAVPPDRLGDYLRQFQSLLRRSGYGALLYGHFGQGCVHARIDFELGTADGVARYRAFLEEAADLVVAHGGSLSGEHGDGQQRAELLPRMFGDELVQAFAHFKAVWDPGNRMNPGKVVDPRPLDADLRVGPGSTAAPVPVRFGYPDDEGSFVRAAARCVGVGACRREGGGTMCPSFMVTREEAHSTRGRARLLQEMLRGEVVPDGWRSEAVRQALDLCLGCKACRRECPANVDMATYKAEFLAHHYEGRLRPASHYAAGWLPSLARLGARAPGLVNAVASAPGVSAVLVRVAGLVPERPLPRLAPRTLQAWFTDRGGSPSRRRQVLLWPDTFTNFFDPAVGRAAVEVLESAGFEVALPPPGLCCGLTFLSTGQLGAAVRSLRRVLTAVRPWLDRGVPVVGLEPSCTAVLRSDLRDLLPSDPDAARLGRHTVTLAELLGREADGWHPRPLRRPALVQLHCHHQAVLGAVADEAVLARAGLDHRILDAGCCGLAGSFGHERGHYDVSMACGERVLLPAVRAAPPEALVVADGFSCRSQIAHGTPRRALHLAQVLALGLAQGDRR